MKKIIKNSIKKLRNFGIYKKSEICNKEELTIYLNKIFEQQEKERIVRWLVNSIRESLELEKVLEKTSEEVSRLLKVDRCLIALFDKENEQFNFRNEYRINTEIVSVLENLDDFTCEPPEPWYKLLLNNFCPVIVNDCNYKDVKSLVMVPIVDKNEILGLISVHQVTEKRNWEDSHVAVLQDIGSQIAIAIKQAILYEKVQETTRLKSEFLSGMSHELRTPLNAIIGFSEMLLSNDYGELTEKQKKFINNISVSGEHLLRLVNDILDLSKIESGNMEINYEVFNLSQTILETVSVLNSLAEKKNINISMNLDKFVYINADLRRFKQIMYNLLSNAVKFTEDNGEIIVIACQEKRNLKVEIHDTGIGISEKNKDTIFRSFRQLDSSLARKQEGSGLGLTLTKKLIELHRGTIDFESEEGKGSMFWFILPDVISQKPV